MSDGKILKYLSEILCMTVVIILVFKFTMHVQRNNDNTVKICDRIGLEYTATTNVFGVVTHLYIK